MAHFGFRTPFAVCLPCPTRNLGGKMIPASVSFDGDSVEVHYPPNSLKRRGWWDGAAVHNFAYHPALTSKQLLIEHATRGHKLSRQQRNRLANLIKPKTCGAGTLIKIEGSMITSVGGRARAGGKWPIFLLSPNGRMGTLVVGNNVYHKYNVGRIHIGRMREFKWLPELTADPQELETFSFHPKNVG